MFTLSEITSTFLGSYEKPVEEGPLPLLLPSDLDSTGRRITQTPTRFASATPATERAQLHPGDVLLPAKGGRYAATLVTDELAGYVASSGFFVLRPNPEVVPAYLAAYLNHPQTQRRLQGITNASTTVPVLNKAALLATTIDLPPLSIQHSLASLHQLWLHEQQLTERLLQQKALLYQQAFQDAIHAATGSFLTA
ncbi:restriction endonuclease subunit S [Hymenobacter lucidus]|uniref:restriction endonuclease subunit S n=1 Tax=Hymenobacter lucidus TaxID=2880930 RepID=UPI001CF3527A